MEYRLSEQKLLKFGIGIKTTTYIKLLYFEPNLTGQLAVMTISYYGMN